MLDVFETWYWRKMFPIRWSNQINGLTESSLSAVFKIGTERGGMEWLKRSEETKIAFGKSWKSVAASIYTKKFVAVYLNRIANESPKSNLTVHGW